MAHEVNANGRPGICEINSEAAQRAADEIIKAEHARSVREQLAKESFIEAVLLPALRRVGTEISNGSNTGWPRAKK